MLQPTEDKEAILSQGEIDEAEKIGNTKAFEWAKQHPEVGEYGFVAKRRQLVIEETLRSQIAKLERLGYYKGLPPSIEEALNSGDGTYRP